jgi:hypothetical protein
MAKLSGLGASVSVADSGSVARVISNDVTDFSFTTPKAVQDVTGVDKSAHEKLQLLQDFTCTIKGVFNTASNMSHDVFKTVCSSAVIRAVVIIVQSKTMTVNCYFNDYALTRSATGEFTWSAPGVLGDGTAPAWT